MSQYAGEAHRPAGFSGAVGCRKALRYPTLLHLIDAISNNTCPIGDVIDADVGKRVSFCVIARGANTCMPSYFSKIAAAVPREAAAADENALA